MHSALVFHPAVGALPFDVDDDLLDAALGRFAERHHIELPALSFGVTRIHPIEIAGKQCRLLATAAAANLDDDVLVVVWILRQQKNLQLLFELTAALFEPLEFLLRQRPHLRVGAFGELLCLGDFSNDALVLAVFVDERFDFRQRLCLLTVFGLIVLDCRRPERRHQLLVSRFDRCELIEHYLSILLRRFEMDYAEGEIRRLRRARDPQITQRERSADYADYTDFYFKENVCAASIAAVRQFDLLKVIRGAERHRRRQKGLG